MLFMCRAYTFKPVSDPSHCTGFLHKNSPVSSIPQLKLNETFYLHCSKLYSIGPIENINSKVLIGVSEAYSRQ